MNKNRSSISKAKSYEEIGEFWVVGKILNESGLIEGYGTGVLRIRKYIQEKGLIQPEFRENNGFFKAIFFNSKVGEEGKEGEAGREEERERREVDREGEKGLKEVDRGEKN